MVDTCSVLSTPTAIYTVQLVIFVGLIFPGLGSSDNFMGLYFCGIPILITQKLFVDKQRAQNPRKFEPHGNYQPHSNLLEMFSSTLLLVLC